MDSETIELETASQLVTEVTRQVVAYCRDRGDGLCHLFVPHATAGLALLETGSGTEPDLDEAIHRLLPQQDIYHHRHGSTGHGRDHVLPAFIAPSLTVPVLGGAPTLGTWQSVVVVDSNRDNPRRQLRMSFLPA